MRTPLQPQDAMPAVWFKPGTRVTIGGLKAKPELNGTIASVENFNVPTGRFNVKLENGTILALKPEALQAVPSSPVEEMGSATAAAPSAVDVSDGATLEPTTPQKQNDKKAMTEEEAKMAAKKAAVEAAVALAMSERAAAEQKLKIGETGLSKSAKKATAVDLFGLEKGDVCEAKPTVDKERDYRMQGEYGAKKFIKP